jgi:hypothetical protein
VAGHLFSPTNTQLVTLFKNSGIHNLRLGGGTVDGPHPAIPSHADIDEAFGFARAAEIKIIYSLPLLDAEATNAAAIARYIWDRYQPYLDCFSIGNEPNEPPYRSASVGAITNYADFLAAWRAFATAVTNAVPAATFSGPESGGIDWVPEFIKDEGPSGRVVMITHHEYIGGKPFIKRTHKELPAAQAIDFMLSRNWVTNEYPHFYQKTSAFAAAAGLPCRMTEANDYLRGVTNASDAFSSAFWALDFMHWWAAHGCAGINFHNNQWLKTDTFYLDDATHEYRINPKAYGIRAFDLGSHGWVESTVITNAEDLNLTAYGVGDETNLYVTIINKEHGKGARDAVVTIKPLGFLAKSAEAMFLTAPGGNAGATSGITLGGALITNDRPWQGEWKVLGVTTNLQVRVKCASAVVVKLSKAGD